MKKNQLFVSLLVAGLCISSPALAQDVVQMTTSKAEGATLTLKFNQLTKGISVDWGDGNVQNYSATDDEYLTVEGTVMGETITVSSPSRIHTMFCENSQLTALDLSGAASLYSLYCQNNELTALDLSACPKLTDLNCANNSIKTLVLSEKNNPELQNVNVSGNSLKSNVKGGSSFSLTCPELQYLNVAGNVITTISFGANNAGLDVLKCSDNSIKTLNLVNIDDLSVLMCGNNSISSFTVNGETGLPELKQVFAENNKIAKMNLSLSAELKYLSVANNALTLMQLPAKKKLDAISCGNNSLTFASLPTSAYKPDNFSYLPQTTEIDVKSKLTKGKDGVYYAKLCPSYADRNNETYMADFTDWAFDSNNQRNTFTYYGKNENDAEYSTLTKASSSNKEGDFYTPTSAATFGKFNFLQQHDQVYFEVTNANYPDLTYTSTVFRVGDVASAIENVTTVSEALQVVPGQGMLLISGNGQQVGVWSTDGKLLWKGRVNAEGHIINLPAGVYIVNGKKVAL
ncbi:hypothetical protein MR642_08170 [bacterium]|nr:hypothetical protein [bacterium]